MGCGVRGEGCGVWVVRCGALGVGRRIWAWSVGRGGLGVGCGVRMHRASFIVAGAGCKGNNARQMSPESVASHAVASPRGSILAIVCVNLIHLLPPPPSRAGRGSLVD